MVQDSASVVEAQREYGQLYTVAKTILTPSFKFAWRVKVDGLQHVPTDGPAILCPNHTSVIDSFMMPVVLPRRISPVFFTRRPCAVTT